MFIGFYNLANTVTLLGLASSVMAMFCAIQQEHELAIVMLLFAGLCDLFDGRIARGSSTRIRREKIYGIQIDSLADIVSFGVAPAFIVYNMGFDRVTDLLLYLFFIICGATRLAYFNTQALSETKDLNMKHYTGIPIPFSCVMLPPLVLIATFLKEPAVTAWIFRVFFFLVGTAYILRIRIKKAGMRFSLVVMGFEVLCVVLLIIRGIPDLLTTIT